jgi:hypothetical protein
MGRLHRQWLVRKNGRLSMRWPGRSAPRRAMRHAPLHLVGAGRGVRCRRRPPLLPGVGVYSKADALLDVARVFLEAAPEDRSGADRTLVVVQVSAEQLGHIPAATPADGNVPAGTPTNAVCHIAGVGSVEPATAQRRACDSPLLGAVVDKHGKVLALGRTRRLVSRRSAERC